MGSFTAPYLPVFLLAFEWVETSIKNSLVVITENRMFIDHVVLEKN